MEIWHGMKHQNRSKNLIFMPMTTDVSILIGVIIFKYIGDM